MPEIARQGPGKVITPGSTPFQFHSANSFNGESEMPAVGSCTITQQNHRSQVKQVVFTWTSDGASGAVSDGAALTPFKVSGEIVRITTDPGSPAPNDNYDIVINDEDGFDVACGFLANRDTANVESIVPRIQGTLPNGSTQYGAPVFVDSTLEVVVTNCGNSKQGVVRVYYV